MVTHEDRGVTSLQGLATDVFFKEVIYKATPSKVESIRGWIDQELVGRVKKDFREECLRKLNQIGDNKNTLAKHQRDLRVLFAPLDCILDSNLTQLSHHIPLPVSYFLSTQLSIISSRCPNLKKLYIETKFDRDIAKILKKQTLSRGPLCLSQLTSLTIKHLGEVYQCSWGRPVLSIIGKFCPALVTLKITGCCNTTEDILGLIVGEWADILLDPFRPDNNKPWSRRREEIIAELQVPSEFLNPICFSLEEIQLKKACGPECYCFGYAMSKYDIAFGLRHLLKLRIAEFPEAVADAILIMPKLRGVSIHQAGFEVFCRESSTRYPKIKRNLCKPPQIIFSGFLSLQEIEISVKNVEVLQTVGMVCPNLAHVCFVEDYSPTLVDGVYDVSDTKVLPYMLKSIIMNEWPKLNSITIYLVDQQFIEPLLEVFGPSLKKLKLVFLKQIELSHLAPCSNLEELTIKHCRDLQASYPINWTTFLPQLKSIKSECCLGNWAPLFERKLGSLVAAQLSCCLIGTDAHNPRIEWNQLPELWPLLESLKLGQCSGLDFDMVNRLIPQMSALRRVKLPRDLFRKDLKRATDIQEYFASKITPVQIEEYDLPSFHFQCSFAMSY